MGDGRPGICECPFKALCSKKTWCIRAKRPQAIGTTVTLSRSATRKRIPALSQRTSAMPMNNKHSGDLQPSHRSQKSPMLVLGSVTH